MVLEKSVLAAVVAGLVSVSSFAAAQACPAGQVATGETSGHCCWPSQRWSAEYGRCDGPPSCPPPLVAVGADCIAAAAAAHPAPSAPVPAPAVVAPPVAAVPNRPAASVRWPLVSTDIGSAVVNPRVVRSSNSGLIVAGIVLTGLGYAAGVVAGIGDELDRSCSSSSCDSWPLGFIPVGGGILAGTVSLRGYRYSVAWGLGLGVPAAVLQSLGISLFITGLASTSEELVPGDRNLLSVQVLPYANQDGAGLTVMGVL